jgi:hypothetical protein
LSAGTALQKNVAQRERSLASIVLNETQKKCKKKDRNQNESKKHLSTEYRMHLLPMGCCVGCDSATGDDASDGLAKTWHTQNNNYH